MDTAMPDFNRLIAMTLMAGMTAAVWSTTLRADDTIILAGLEWATTSNGENMPWPEAIAYCEALNLAGHADWRLPTLDELADLHEPESGEGIRAPFVIGDCCLWSGESLQDRPAEDGDEIGGRPQMYHWGFMFDGGLPYYAVHIFDDGRALCVREAEPDAGSYQ